MAAPGAREGEARREDAAAEEALLERYQRAAFGYFLRNRNPANGLYADNSRDWSTISIAVVGFALSAYPVAVERGWIARGEAVEHCTAALRFFRDSNQDGSPDSTGYKGFYRSEEHTSELQSQMRITYAVFCLKKTNMN